MKIEFIICMHDFCNVAAVNKDYCHQTAKCYAASLSLSPPEWGGGENWKEKRSKIHGLK